MEQLVSIDLNTKGYPFRWAGSIEYHERMGMDRSTMSFWVEVRTWFLESGGDYKPGMKPSNPCAA